jgi:hypothetical protein
MLLPTAKRGRCVFLERNGFPQNADQSQSPQRTNLSLGDLFNYVQYPTYRMSEYFPPRHGSISRFGRFFRRILPGRITAALRFFGGDKERGGFLDALQRSRPLALDQGKVQPSFYVNSTCPRAWPRSW